MLAFACTDNGDDTSWLAKLENVDAYGDYDPLVYNDAADYVFGSYQDIHQMMVTFEEEYKGIADEIANNPEYADYTDEEIQDLLPDSYAEYAVVHATLSQYQYNGEPLLNFFMNDPYEVDTDEFFPILSVMTPGQRQIIKFVGLNALIAFAQSDKESASTFVKAMKGACDLFAYTEEAVSVYYGIDRSLFEDGGVALTTASLRKSASTGDSSWFSGDHVDPQLSTSLHIVAGSCAVLAIGSAIGAKMATNAARAVYQTVLKAETAKLPARLAMMEKTILRQAMSIAQSAGGGEAAVDAGISMVIKQRSAQIARLTSGDYPSMLAKQAAANLTRLGITLNVVLSVAMGATLIIEGINLGITVYNYYHPDYTEIPRIIVDEVAADNETYYVNYYAAKDQTGESGDLNAWSAQRWNALYTTTDKKAGNPILASSLTVKLKDSTFPDDDSAAVHYFGEPAAANVNRYQFKKTATATYIFYKRDASLSMTASTFSGGQLIMFTGFGLIGGLAIGSLSVIGAGKIKKKKENEPETEA